MTHIHKSAIYMEKKSKSYKMRFFGRFRNPPDTGQVLQHKTMGPQKGKEKKNINQVPYFHPKIRPCFQRFIITNKSR